MKRCPRCNQTYNDGSLNFCLLDGTPLVATDSEPTVVMPKPAVGMKRKVLVWAAGIVLVILVGTAGLAAGLIYYYRGTGEGSRGGRQDGLNAQPTPKPPATPRPTSPAAVSPVEEPTPSVGQTTPTPADEDTDEVTPIAWNTSAIQFKGDVGKIYKFQCPEGGSAGTIWGNDIYTQDSSICTAAVHAGVIDLDDGGVVTVEFRPGRLTYGSTVRNGITSNTFGEYARSFVVR